MHVNCKIAHARQQALKSRKENSMNVVYVD